LQELQADSAAVLLKENLSENLRVQAAKGLPDAIVGTTCLIDESDILFLVIMNNEPIVLQGGYVRLPFLPERFSARISSTICAPIRIGETFLGLLNVNRMQRESPFSQSDLRTVEIVALQAAVAIQNARSHELALERRKLEQELSLASLIQQNLLPKPAAHAGHCEIGCRNLPARSVGGDFYDIIKFDDNLFGFAIGDVAGKGVPGALLMMRVLSSFRAKAQGGRDPAAVLEELNADLLEGGLRGLYATVLYAVLDVSRSAISVANAGHPPPLIRNSRTRAVHSVDTHVGVPLGVLKRPSYQAATFAVEPEDTVLFYTDGLIEARDANQQYFSEARIRKAVEHGPEGAAECAAHLCEEVARFTAGMPQHDDLTLLAIRPLLESRK
jgi:serine phosphatase RsbU (regulator of sigma subunit)